MTRGVWLDEHDRPTSRARARRIAHAVRREAARTSANADARLEIGRSRADRRMSLHPRHGRGRPRVRTRGPAGRADLIATARRDDPVADLVDWIRSGDPADRATEIVEWATTGESGGQAAEHADRLHWGEPGYRSPITRARERDHCDLVPRIRWTIPAHDLDALDDRPDAVDAPGAPDDTGNRRPPPERLALVEAVLTAAPPPPGTRTMLPA